MAKTLTVTPVGVAIYPHLTSPDTKFEKDGVWHVKINVTDKKWAKEKKAEIVAAANAALTEAKEKNKGKKPVKGQKPPKLALCEDMPFTDDEDGSTTFNFKMYATGTDKEGKQFKMQPTIVDSKGKPMKGKVKIGNDSELRVSFEMSPFFQPKIGAGVTLRLYGAQIIKLVEFGGRSAASLGFDAVEGGFDSEGYDAGEDAEDGDAPDTDETDGGYDDFGASDEDDGGSQGEGDDF